MQPQFNYHYIIFKQVNLHNKSYNFYYLYNTPIVRNVSIYGIL